MSRLVDALKKKFKSPWEALVALGLDKSILESKTPQLAGDSKEKTMPKVKLSPCGLLAMGAISQYLAPRLAQDSKVDLSPILIGVTSKNFASKKPYLVTAIRSAVAGSLAQDADTDDVGEIISQIEELAAEAGEAIEGPGGDPDDMGEKPLGEGEHEGEHEETEDDGDNHVAEFLKDKLSPEDLATVIKMMGHGEKEAGEQSMDEWDTRAEDARKRLGRDESVEERDEREKKQSAEDARKRLGRGGGGGG